MTRLYKTWCERFNTGVTNAQAVRFCKGPFLQAIGEQTMRGHTSMTTDECRSLLARVQMGVPVAGQSNSVGFNGDDAERGRQWLARNAKRFGFPQLAWDTITHFTFVNVHIHDRSPHGYWIDARPVYRAHFPDGSTFDYSPSPWQAGMTAARRRAKPVTWKYHPAREVPA